MLENVRVIKDVQHKMEYCNEEELEEMKQEHND